ncbi:glycosyltransferase family 4 protein [Roseomonas gilardii subsp. gilardii]|uniref:glycosyltransferase family 4 protein n=1 Tax=Roseomonas gilardii TaxID=257708 RepID=UPI001FF99882|nr:glycosyltransferase family 1 protein [Roseomonas gilardii]UPG73128.1 glycosyltransferase family 4 protein [Roseomonas gilardii subsp. gilardii]
MPPEPVRRTLWVDVEDLFQYALANPRPSGIQRLVFEILRVLPERAARQPDAPRIAFVRHDAGPDLLREVPFAEVAALFGHLSAGHGGNPVSSLPPRRQLALRVRRGRPFLQRLRFGLIHRLQKLPPRTSEALLQAAVLQMNVLRTGRRGLALWRNRRQGGALSAGVPAASMAAPSPVEPGVAVMPASSLRAQPGDVFLILGAAWVHTDYAGLLRRLRQRHGLRPALLLYDLIPLRRPEWCARDLVRSFRHWVETVLPECPRLMAISHATAHDVEAYAAETGLVLEAPVRPIPIGTGFGLAGQADRLASARPRGLPRPGSYVLFVSTLEARKNHALLFRVWRRLLSEMPREQVPTLVFAGRVGWLVADLMQQLENAEWLGGKIRLVRDPSDEELLALYRGCRFTLFPSLFEGWGLPVSESLALGRPCIASDRTSLPEAGALARYFDPDDLDDACATIRAVIEDPQGLEEWRERVAREFRHVPWSDSADAILEGVLAPPAQAAGPAQQDQSA